jgi:hypothetical protein
MTTAIAVLPPVLSPAESSFCAPCSSVPVLDGSDAPVPEPAPGVVPVPMGAALPPD